MPVSMETIREKSEKFVVLLRSDASLRRAIERMAELEKEEEEERGRDVHLEWEAYLVVWDAMGQYRACKFCYLPGMLQAQGLNDQALASAVLDAPLATLNIPPVDRTVPIDTPQYEQAVFDFPLEIARPSLVIFDGDGFVCLIVLGSDTRDGGDPILHLARSVFNSPRPRRLRCTRCKVRDTYTWQQSNRYTCKSCHREFVGT